MTELNAQHTRPLAPRPWRRLMVFGLALVLAAGVLLDRCAERAGKPAAFADAERIWIDRPAEVDAAGTPVAFWAIKDFALTSEEVLSSAQSARLLVLGDPSVVVYWNGLLIHSTEFQAKQPVIPIQVGPLLQTNNRIVIEGRSDVGTGGLMAALWLELPGEGTKSAPVWVTDSDWQIAEKYDANLLTGLLPLAAVEGLSVPKVWSQPGLGRWRPLTLAARAGDINWPSQRSARKLPASRSQFKGAPYEPGETEPWPDGVVLTFDSMVEGCLGLGRAELFKRRVFFLDHASVLEQLRGPKDLVEEQGLVWTHRTERVLSMPGAPIWLDSTERRFRSVFLEGVPEGSSDRMETAWVQPCAGAPKALAPRRLLARR